MEPTMGATDWKGRLEIVINACVLIAALMFLGILITNYSTRTDNKPALNDLKKGSQMVPLKGVDFAKSKKTLVLFLNSQCKYCEKSAPFYAQLARTEHEYNDKVQIVAVFSSSGDETLDFMSTHRLALDTVPDADYAALTVSMTPSIALVDGNGKILDSWVGLLTPRNEAHVLGLLK
jgi:thioredoxin-related protein